MFSLRNWCLLRFLVTAVHSMKSLRRVWGLCPYLLLWCVYREAGIVHQSKPLWVFVSVQIDAVYNMCGHMTLYTWICRHVPGHKRSSLLSFWSACFLLFPCQLEFAQPEISNYFKYQQDTLYFFVHAFVLYVLACSSMAGQLSEGLDYSHTSEMAANAHSNREQAHL